jgi:protein-export membrane protein SecD
MRRAGIQRFLVSVQQAQNRITVRVDDPAQIQPAMGLLRELSTAQPGQRPDLEFEQSPGGLITVTLSPIGLRERATAAVAQSIEIVRRRIDETGVVDPVITPQGEARIVVQLPGVEDPNRIKQLLGKTARMTFRLTDETANLAQSVPPPGVDFLTLEGRGGGRIAVRRRIEVDGANLIDARAGQDTRNSQWVVNFTFDSVGTRRFAEISRNNVGRPFAIVLDDKVISAPVINEPILGGSARISRRAHGVVATGPAAHIQHTREGRDAVEAEDVRVARAEVEARVREDVELVELVDVFYEFNLVVE